MKNSQKGSGIVISIVIIALLVIAGGIYRYSQRDKAQVIEDAISIDSDTRQLLGPEQYKYKEGSNSYLDLSAEISKSGGLNLKQPTTFVTYENKDRGIEFSVPYNPAWGSAKYKIAPYEYEKGLVTDKGADDEKIIFGPIQPWEGGGLARLQSLSFIPARTADSLMENTLAVVKTEKKRINGLEVVEFSGGEFCGYSYIEIIGEKYNYILSDGCDNSYNAPDNPSPIDMRYLEGLVEKMKLI